MEKLSTVVYGIIALVVVVIITFTAIIPVIEDAQNEQITIMNNTGERFNMATSTEKVVIGFNSSHQLIINGETWAQTSSHTVALSDTIMIWANSSNVAFLDFERNYTHNYTGAVSDFITFEDGTYSYTISDVEYTGSYTFLFYPSADGEYGSYSMVSGVNINVGQEFYAYRSATNFSKVIFKVASDGTITRTNTPPEPTTTITMDLTRVDGEYNLYQTVTGSFTATPIDPEGGDPTTATGSFIAPIKYTGVTSSNSMICVLLGIIPLMLVIVPVMLAVQLMTVGRRD